MHLTFVAALAASLVFSGQALAASARLNVSGEVFEGLPGVKPLGPEEPEYRCQTVTKYSGRRNGMEFFDDNMPYLAYRCERNGYVYEGSRPPISGRWIPGINP